MEVISLDNTSRLRTRVLIGICGLLSLIGLLLAFINLVLTSPTFPKVTLGVLQLCYSLLSLYLLKLALNNRHKKWHAHLYIYVLTALVIFAINIARLESFLFCWALTLPTIYFLLLGKKAANIPTTILFLSAIYDILNKSNFSFSPPIVNFICSFFIIWVVSYVYEKNREYSELDLQKLALLDPLTQSYNRLALAKKFNQLSQATRGDSFCILILDIDFFKEVNDTFGHEAGDIILQGFAEFIRKIAKSENAFRIGGEEFCIIVETDEIIRAVAVAESIRQTLSEHPFIFEGKTLTVTVSIGVAKFQPNMTLSNLLAKGDAQLYVAKRAGRNRVACDAPI